MLAVYFKLEGRYCHDNDIQKYLEITWDPSYDVALIQVWDYIGKGHYAKYVPLIFYCLYTLSRSIGRKRLWMCRMIPGSVLWHRDVGWVWESVLTERETGRTLVWESNVASPFWKGRSWWWCCLLGTSHTFGESVQASICPHISVAHLGMTWNSCLLRNILLNWASFLKEWAAFRNHLE